MIGLAALLAVMGACLFLPAGTLDFWRAWGLLGLFGAASLAVTVQLMVRDPALLARRVAAGPGAEPTGTQKVIQAVTGLLFLSLLVVPGLDRRFGWSAMPAALSLLGDVLVLAAFAFIGRVYAENSFASATIEIYEGQSVISTGPYAVVRHPMYLGALVMLFGMTLALGSWWGLAPVVAFAPALAWRTLDEEGMLEAELPGYRDYEARVRHRLLPGLW